MGVNVNDGTVVWKIERPLSVFGGVIYDRILAKRNTPNALLTLIGGDNLNTSSYLNLFGNFPGSEGVIQLGARNQTNTSILNCKPNGDLTWADNDLGGSAIVAKSLNTKGYIKYASRLIIQWGNTTVSAANTVITAVFPISFTANLCTVSILPYTAGGYNNYVIPICTYKMLSGIQFECSAVPSQDVNWIAIGY